MLRVRKITKITRLIPLSDIVGDLKSDASDEDVMAKHKLSWGQLAKVYSKLFYGGAISREDLARRFEMRRGKRVSHIPLVRIEASALGYRCSVCGFVSERHFSVCPECSGLNLRRLIRRRLVEKRRPLPPAGAGYDAPSP
jgi:hypothetical protein